MSGLYINVKKAIFTMSGLDEVSVYPKPIERQGVEPCLKVFSKKSNRCFGTVGQG